MSRFDLSYSRKEHCRDFIAAFPDAPTGTFVTNKNSIWMVARIDGFVVGVCCAEIKGKDTWEYRSAYIHPLFREQGIYEALSSYRKNYVDNFHVKIGSEVMQYPETWRKDGLFPPQDIPNNSIVGFWPIPETTDMNFTVMEQHYRALACTYGMDLQMVEKPSQIIITDHRPWISIEEYREEKPGVRYDQFEYPEEAIYLVGNSAWRHMSDIFEIDHIINVPTPGGFAHPLYGNQVAAIVFQQRHLQHPFLLPEESCGTLPA